MLLLLLSPAATMTLLLTLAGHLHHVLSLM
jgi:hypothetical protein